MIIPIAQKKEGVLDKAYELKAALQNADIRVDIDDSPNQSPGWKFNEYEMKGMPLRVEIGPRDIKNNQAVVVRRDTLEKQFISLDDFDKTISDLLETMQSEMLEKAREERDKKHMPLKAMRISKSSKKKILVLQRVCGAVVQSVKQKSRKTQARLSVVFHLNKKILDQHATSVVSLQSIWFMWRGPTNLSRMNQVKNRLRRIKQ